MFPRVVVVGKLTWVLSSLQHHKLATSPSSATRHQLPPDSRALPSATWTSQRWFKATSQASPRKPLSPHRRACQDYSRIGLLVVLLLFFLLAFTDLVHFWICSISTPHLQLNHVVGYIHGAIYSLITKWRVDGSRKLWSQHLWCIFGRSEETAIPQWVPWSWESALQTNYQFLRFLRCFYPTTLSHFKYISSRSR